MLLVGHTPPTPAPADIITITSIDPVGQRVVCRHGDGKSTVTAAGGWQFTKRPRRSSFTEFMGYDAITLVVPIMLGDGTDRGQNVDKDVQDIYVMSRNLVGARSEPPVLKLDCPLLPFTWFDWVIQDIAIVEEFRRNDGSRYYCTMNVTFYQYVGTDLVATRAPVSVAQKVTATAKAQSASSQVTTAATSSPLGYTSGGYTTGSTLHRSAAVSTAIWIVRKGDTLETIAMQMLGSAKQWKTLAALNGNIRDPKSVTVGQIIRLPDTVAASGALPTPTFTTPVTVTPRTQR